MTLLVTGAAGFIGYHCARALLQGGEMVTGVDDLNGYYSVDLKRDRLRDLQSFSGFRFHQLDIADGATLRAALAGADVRRVIHLAAQPGVRYSFTNPEAFIRSNLVGFANVLEYCRHADGFEHMVYASSSSVYGGNTKLPFAEADAVDRPISLYAATKRSNELMSHTYAHLYDMSLTGLRFFTVYGPSGRPDMAVWSFAEAILAGRPIPIFNHGQMKRDFTYIDDIVAGVLAVTQGPVRRGGEQHRIYNIGNNRPEDLMVVIGLLEDALGRSAKKEFLPMQPGDLVETFADITAIRADYGFEPKTPVEVGIPKFAAWYLEASRVASG